MAVGFYSLEETRERLGKSEQELRELASEGKLNLVEDDGAVWFSAADVDEIGGGGGEDVVIDLDVIEAPPPPPKRKGKKPRGASEPSVAAMSDAEVMIARDTTSKKDDLADVPIALEPEEAGGESDGMSKIKSFGGKGISSIQGTHDTSHLKRDVNQTGSGATRCRTFHAKLNDASLAYLNNQVNDWVDSDESIEIKFATSSVGVVEGKHAEPHLIVTVFY